MAPAPFAIAQLIGLLAYSAAQHNPHAPSECNEKAKCNGLTTCVVLVGQCFEVVIHLGAVKQESCLAPWEMPPIFGVGFPEVFPEGVMTDKLS